MPLVRKVNPANTDTIAKKQIIKVNPYENPDNVMELMAKICSATPSADSDVYWKYIRDAYNKKNYREKSLSDLVMEKKRELYNLDFKKDLYDLCREVSWTLSARENTEHTQIVVAGGFSSGKSSFLNRITNSVNLLPTGVEPVSVVKTYLYCSSMNRHISVKGVNQKNTLVNLNPGVLQAIQHSKDSNIYLASVLDKLFVEIPSTDLDGLVFIDTPGYNNSDKANQSNGKTDRETALEALGEGNVLFWLVDCEKGTTVSDDLNIIKQFNGKKVFIFNKADKKGMEACADIVEQAANTLYKEFPKDEIIDIIAYSTLESKIYYSKNNMTLSDIIKAAKSTGNGFSELNSKKEQIAELFDNEISNMRDNIKKIEDEYKESVEYKNECQKDYNASKEDKEYIISGISKIIDERKGLSSSIEDFTLSSKYNYNAFLYFYRAVNSKLLSSFVLAEEIEKAKKRITQLNKIYDEAVEKYRQLHCLSDDEYKAHGGLVEAYVNANNDNDKAWYELYCNKCNKLLVSKKETERMLEDMKEYKSSFMYALECGIKIYQKQNYATNVDKEYTVPNVFDCIRKDDTKLFLHSFENGVDMSVCDADGFSPLTLAVHNGNNFMVQFMLDKGADPTMKDKRGYNAFHTAVENQYRDICKILLDSDPELVETTTDSGETVETLGNKQTFVKWIEHEINNAF